MLCKCGCGQNATGRSSYYSNACRQRYFRNIGGPQNVPGVTEMEQSGVKADRTEPKKDTKANKAVTPTVKKSTLPTDGITSSLKEIREYFKGSPTVLSILNAGPAYPVEFGSCCVCGRKFTQEGFEKVIVCSTCFHRVNSPEVSSLEAGCSCAPTDREGDCSQCSRAGIPCTHKFFFCVEHQYHIGSYCLQMCA